MSGVNGQQSTVKARTGTERVRVTKKRSSDRASGSVKDGSFTRDPVVNRVQFEIKMGLSEIKNKDSLTRYRGLVHLIKLLSGMDKKEVDALVLLQKTPPLDIILSVMSATFVEYADGEDGIMSGGKERVAAMHLLEGLCLMDPFFSNRLGSVKGVELLTSYVMGKQSRIPARFDPATRERIRLGACWTLMALLCKTDKNCQTFLSTKGPGKLASIIGNAGETRSVRVAVIMSMGMLMAEDVQEGSEWRKKLVTEAQLAVALLPGHGRLQDMMELGRRSLEYQNNGGEDVRDSPAMHKFLTKLDTVDV